MKVNLGERGAMVVTAESPIESFALSHWFALWQDHKSTLQVQTVERMQPVEADASESGGIR